jgi:hypothetical protein
MYEIERLIKGHLIFGVKYLMLQSPLNGILYQLFSAPILLVVNFMFYLLSKLRQRINRVSFPYFEVVN